MKHLIFLTNHFPFGDGEAFIESEFVYLRKEFEKITIISSTTDQKLTRDVGSNCDLLKYDPKSSLIEKMAVPFLALRYIKLLYFFVNNEIKIIHTTNIKLNIKLLSKILHDILKGLQFYNFLKRKIIDVENEKLFYSYWLSTQATALMIAKKNDPKIKAISRGHSIDIYPFRTELGYIPFEKQKIEILDKTFFVSQHGINYYKEFFRYKPQKIILAPLGTNTPLKKHVDYDENNFVLLSCSNIVEVKRLHLIIEALSLIDSIQIKWIHIGNGKLRSNMESLAKLKLAKKENVSFQFLGQMLNNEVHKFLANNKVDLFINVSSIEAIPVTIREAMSYGIPCIATKVGGNIEIVNESNGFLIEENPSPQNIAFIINKYHLFSDENKYNISQNAYKTWEKNYSSKKVYPVFIDFIKKIMEQK